MRIGILSFAHLHAMSYVQNVRAIPGVELMGIADEDAARGRSYAEQYSAPFYDSYEALLDAKPDGVIVCSENTRHARLALMAADAGAHVLCEKPLATTVADCRAMIDACSRAGVNLMTAFPMRFNAPAREVKQVMDSGQLGRIYGCSTTNNGECPVRHRAWFVDKALAGGGALMDHVVHLTDLLRWYLQEEVVEVYAQTNQILYAADAPDVETGGLVMLTFEDGTFASIDCSWNKPPYYPTWGGLAMEIVGEGGFVTMDAFKQRMTVHSHETQRGRYAGWGSNADQAMVEEFVASVREAREPFVTGDDGLKATEVVEAAYRSVAEGRPVRLPLE